MRSIDRLPPMPTGSSKADIQAITDYIFFLREQLNLFIAETEREKNSE